MVFKKTIVPYLVLQLSKQTVIRSSKAKKLHITDGKLILRYKTVKAISEEPSASKVHAFKNNISGASVSQWWAIVN